MGKSVSKNLKTGNKKPKSTDKQSAHSHFVPLPKMYQIGKRAGITQEQERIILLIDSLDLSFEGGEGDNFIVGDAIDLIALIKGEK